jgi:LPXTG-motif cell wall-anchored protein
MKKVRRALLLLAAATLVWAAAQPLARTEWAERVRQTGEVASRRRREREDRSPAVRRVLPLVKDFVIMGIPALITLGALALLRRRRRAELTSSVSAVET